MILDILGWIIDAIDGGTELVDAADTADAATAAEAGSQVGAPKFGGDVQFPDGSTVTNPHQDALGYVYPDTDSYISGTDKHTLSGS